MDRPNIGSVIAVVLLATFWSAGCAVKEKPLRPPTAAPALERLTPAAYPRFVDDMNFDGLAHSLEKSLLYLKRQPPDRTFGFGADRFTTVHMIRSIERFARFIDDRPSTPALNRFIAENYRVYRAAGNNGGGQVLFTGYYEPLLRGSTVQTATYSHPIYARPDDHLTADLSPFGPRFKGVTLIGRIDGNRFVPYYDRQAIDEKGALRGKTRALAYIKDPVDLFFLHIQGSGKIFLENGRVMNVHYHTTNGRPYRSIGGQLIDQGQIPPEQMSMQAIRAWLKANPEQRAALFNTNPSYVFFKEEAEGPLGSLSVKLTPGRSIATDYRIFPAAALSFIEARKPLVDAEGRIHTWADLRCFALNQDTGGAIRGPGRADLFWGNGRYAELAAGHMKHEGAMYFLVLKPEAG